MKVGIFVADSNGWFTVPAVKGGAVQQLVENLANANEEKFINKGMKRGRLFIPLK